MATYDVYAGTRIAAGDWSGDVSFTPASNGEPASVEVGALGGAAVTLRGTVSQAGDPVTLTMTLDGTPFEGQLAAVCDVPGAAVFSNGSGYFLFASHPLEPGATYAAGPGFGLFGAATPPACFVEGTRIETHRGLVPVEQLRLGDRVRTLVGGSAAPVIWTGRRDVVCGAFDDPARCWPVRVAAGAFGPAMPLRDVYLSPDHAVFVAGVLVPIRCLLNDATIAVQPRPRVTYWHVELPAHDVLLADGLPAESYLDTGNRGSFEACCPAAGAGRPVPAALLEDGGWMAGRAWSARACAPLVLDPAALGDIRPRLHARALALGFAETPDAGLRLCEADGAALPAYWDGVRAIASVPAGCRRLTLRSRTALPRAQLAGNPDERRLGVAVRRIGLAGGDIPLDGPAALAGWHRMEDGFRWTDGAAELALPPADRARTIEIETVPMLRYWLPRPAAGGRAAEVALAA
jgi:hypothetical protein